jgi:formylglycine-generating enzyme required for sulfatase activity
MKKNYLHVALVAVFLVAATTGCPVPPEPPGLAAGDPQTFTADGASFDLVYVPGKTFPTWVDDLGAPVTVECDYWIGETEVTFALWSTVYDWAIENGCFFANSGVMGDGTDDSVQHPVSTVNWRDCLVWCNAATEWYNAKAGTSYKCVYTYSSVPIKDSRDGNATACDNTVANPADDGFRLLSSNEWELAARWRNNATNTVAGYSHPWFTRGNSASGATADFNYAAATQAVAWYADNSGSSMHIVKKRTANSLGLFDMSGNVWEWCFDLWSISDRAMRGGSWYRDVSVVQVGDRLSHMAPYAEFYDLGFRLARTQK